MVSQLQKLPTVETFGTLELITHFDGGMPTEVTVSSTEMLVLQIK
jgi:hypothetical protein